MDMLGATPAFDLDNSQWPIFGSVYDGPPARFIDGEVYDSLIGEGCRIEGGTVKRSVLGSGIRIGKGAEIQDSVVMDHTEIGPGVRLKGVIVDRFNHVPSGLEVGVGSGHGEERFFRDPSGLFVLERGETRALA